jgi:hypothetical protein
MVLGPRRRKNGLSPVGVFVPPSPVRTLLFGFEAVIFPVALLAPFFHQPVSISLILVLVPFVPIPAVAIIIPVVFLRESNDRGQQRSAKK